MQLKYPPARRRRRSRRRGKTRSARTRERERKREGTKHFQARAQMAKPPTVVVCFICFVVFPRFRAVSSVRAAPEVSRAKGGKKIRAQAFGISRAAGIVSLTRAAAVAAAVERERRGDGFRFPARMLSCESCVRNTPGRRDRMFLAGRG